MPELPEVETIRSILEKSIVGKKITKVAVLMQNQFHGNAENLIGKYITAVSRHGKVLAFELNDASFISFHFKLSGQLLYAENMNNAVYKNPIPLAQTNKMPGKSTRVIIYFSGGSGLFFNEMRMFGWVKYSTQIEGPRGVDILSSQFTKDYFAKCLQKTRRAIKVVMLEQNAFAGIGNIYANEALFEAQIHPETPANQLSANKIADLYSAIITVIKKGIQFHGSSGKDEVYVLPDSSKGEFQYHFMVYQQDGKTCKQCNMGIIQRIKQAGRSSFYCSTCQK